jgi:hypothetical protein
MLTRIWEQIRHYFGNRKDRIFVRLGQELNVRIWAACSW